jgi:hypothetical protein
VGVGCVPLHLITGTARFTAQSDPSTRRPCPPRDSTLLFSTRLQSDDRRRRHRTIHRCCLLVRPLSSPSPSPSQIIYPNSNPQCYLISNRLPLPLGPYGAAEAQPPLSVRRRPPLHLQSCWPPPTAPCAPSAAAPLAGPPPPPCCHQVALLPARRAVAWLLCSLHVSPPGPGMLMKLCNMHAELCPVT